MECYNYLHTDMQSPNYRGFLLSYKNIPSIALVGISLIISIILGPTTTAEFAVISHEKDFFLSEYKSHGGSNEYWDTSCLSFCFSDCCLTVMSRMWKWPHFLGRRGKGGFLLLFSAEDCVSWNIFLRFLTFHNYSVIVVLWIQM